MSIRSGAGGAITITAGADEELAAPYKLAAWGSGKDYVRDDQVTTASTDGSSETKFWVALDDHTAASGDSTGETNTKAGVLDAAHWRELEFGQLWTVTSWTLTRPTETTDGATLLGETSPRTSQTPGAPTLAVELLDNFEGSPLQRVLQAVNSRVYVRLFPHGKGAGREVVSGYCRVGEFSATGNQTDDVSQSVTLTADGDFLSAAQT